MAGWLPLLFLLPALHGGSSMGALDACSSQVTVTLQGSAPLQLGAERQVNGTGFGCYALFVSPEFPFHGILRVELLDGFGGRASAQYVCLMTGISGLPLCSFSASTPTLVAGPGMTLRASVEDVFDAGTLAAAGVWQAGVTLGQPA